MRIPRFFAFGTLLAASCLAGAAPVAASYFVFARVGVSVGSGIGTCTETDDSGALVAPSVSASAVCPSGTGQATADLTTASIALFASANSTPQVPTYTSAEAEFFDVVQFQVPPGLQGAPFPLGVVFALDGTISADATPTVTALLSSRCILSDTGTFETFDGLIVDTEPVSGLRTVAGTLSITPPNYAMNVSMHLLAPGLTEGIVDFQNTARLQLALPPGVTYTSDSGVFQAPEPDAVAVGAASLAALVARIRSVRARAR